MKVISVMNYKGGVGKTTITANLPGELAFRGYNVLLLDVDPQTSLTFSFIKPDIWHRMFLNSKTLKEWFKSIIEDDRLIPLKNFIHVPEVTNRYLMRKGQLSLISSDLGLINVDLELASKLGGANLTQSKRNYLKVHQWIKKGLKDLESENYDIVLIDCPPNFNIVTKNSIVASDYILIPAKADYLSTLGIDYLIRSVNTLIKEFNEYGQLDDGTAYTKINPKILGVVFTMVQTYLGEPIIALRQYINQTKDLGSSSGFSVFKTYLKENKSIFANSPEASFPVVLKRASNATEKEVIQGIEEFTTEFINQING